ncbi:PPA1309 family protein [Aeromicrobium fastidiosum]|uniref:PPA1309 family protein n=1 Tax=Aeromicrobium fastidiosum TaxID=52699 RepID=UPI0020232D63|nr:PPA1309 family protein [Aeromicrobium fastidiosum]MCL8250360.1 PPA1309 family protein [Aeromicrobium fastidiosum]
MQLMPDSPLRRAALEVEAHVAAEGWDQSPRLFALVPTADLIAHEPALADQLSSDPDGITPVEQELDHSRELEDLLTEIEWPEAVIGCAAVIERIMLPPEAEESLPDDPEALVAAAAAHPDRQEVRLVAAVVRDGQSHSAVRAREPLEAELLEGPDLVPGLIEHLRSTLTAAP